jgi:anthranilate phosphoribosyltransferase
MHSITPVLRRLSRRGATSPIDASARLDVDEAAALWGAVLDGGLPDLELGALLAVLSLSGESAEELLGFHQALAARCARFAPNLPRRAISIPAYGLVPGEAVLAVLLALFLRRFDVPVVLHGILDSPAGPSVPALLRELGTLPSATLSDAARDLRAHGVAFVPAQLLSPALATVLSLRTRLGTTNVAHVAAHAMDPGGMGALRLAMGVRGSPGERLASLLASTGGEALWLAWPPGATPDDLTRRPQVTLISGGIEEILFESATADRSGHGTWSPPSPLLPWMRAIIDRRAPAPLALVSLATACIHAAGASVDFAQAKAIVALQSGRLAA